MKFSIIISFILALTLSISSCKKADVQFGNEFLDNGLTQIVMVDSFAPTMSTVLIDSFSTSNKGSLVIGSYIDPYFGKITSESFFDINPPSYADIYAQTTYDSIRLILKPNSFYAGDTTVPVHFTTSRLSEVIASKNFDLSNQYYSNQTFKVSSILGSESKMIAPVRRDEVQLKIDDALGQTLFSELQNPNNTVLKTSKDFINYFNGLKINASIGDNAMYGFSDTVILRVYYRKGAAFPKNLTADFTLTNKLHQFNHITVDRSNIKNSTLKNISLTNKEIPSTATDNIAYCQSFTGLMTKIRFKTINDVQKLPNFAKILKAQLVIRPVTGSFDFNGFQLPKELRLSTTNSLNQIQGDITNVAASGSYIQYGNLYIDYLNSTGTEYTYDLTPYIKSLLNNTTGINNGLLLSPPSPAFQNKTSRVMLGNSFNPNGRAQLIIYYAAAQ